MAKKNGISGPANTNAAIRDLAKEYGLIDEELNEWDGQGKGFFNQYYRRLHPQGSHPGLSDKDDCSFRMQLVIITNLELLNRFDQKS